MVVGQLLRNLPSYSRHPDLALALWEIARIECMLFLTDWVLDVNMQRRACIRLNKGEAHHALKSAPRIGC